MVCVGFYLRNILLQPCHNTDTFKVYNLLLCEDTYAYRVCFDGLELIASDKLKIMDCHFLMEITKRAKNIEGTININNLIVFTSVLLSLESMISLIFESNV